MIDVSRRTLPQSNCGRVLHPERDGRVRRREETERALIKAALQLMEKGNFRPSGKEISLRAGLHPSAVNRLFGSRDLMMRVMAREHCRAVVRLIPLDLVCTEDDQRAVWLVLVGQPRDLP